MRARIALGIACGLVVFGCQKSPDRSAPAERGAAPGTPPATSATPETAPNAAPPGKAQAITDVEWALVELHGQAPGTTAGNRPPTLQLATEANRAAGFAGCNRFTGQYKLDGPQLRFSQLAMTRMACTAGMDVELQYAGALAATRSYRFADGTLELSDSTHVVARFQIASK
jgi:heat shock protein HslJ